MENQILRGRSHVNLEVSSLFARILFLHIIPTLRYHFHRRYTNPLIYVALRLWVPIIPRNKRVRIECRKKKKRREGIRGGTIAERSMTRRLRWRCSHLGASNLPSTYTYCLLESSILYISSDFNYYILFIVTRHLVLPRRVDSSLDKFQKLRKERKRFSANAMKHGWESSTLGSSRGGAKNVDNLDKSS